jgi:hypothetical protein
LAGFQVSPEGRRIERFEEAVDLAPSLVVVEESVQRRHHPSTGAHHDATNIVLIGGLVGDKDAVVVESAVGDEHVEVHVQLQGRTEALHKGDGSARRALHATTTKPSALPRKQHAKARLKSGRDEVWSTAQGEPHRNRKREHPLPIRHARQDVVDEVGGGVLGAARRARGADAASLA